MPIRRWWLLHNTVSERNTCKATAKPRLDIRDYGNSDTRACQIVPQ